MIMSKVVIVHDDESYRKSMVDLLAEIKKCNVENFSNASDALHWLKEVFDSNGDLFSIKSIIIGVENMANIINYLKIHFLETRIILLSDDANKESLSLTDPEIIILEKPIGTKDLFNAIGV